MLLNAARELNSYCPIMIDRDTRVDKVTAMPGKKLICHYTLLNREWDGVDADSVARSIMPQIFNHVRTSPDMVFLREHNVAFVYRYRDMNGRSVLKLSITPDMYKYLAPRNG
jgi:hypothetical protein